MSEISLPVLLLGACIGSFLNVVSIRIPKNKSFIYGRSECPHCKKKLEIPELFPIISWIFLKAKCKNCSKSISIRYPLVEIFTSFLFLLCLNSSGYVNKDESSLFLIISGWILVSFLIVLTIIDYEEMILPNSLTFTGAFLGIFLALLYDLFISNSSSIVFIEHIIAYLIALFGMYLFGKIVSFLFRKIAFGVGDAKLFAMSGAWLGINGLEVTITLSFLIAGIFSIIGILIKSIKIGDYIPFGPFISIATFLVWMFGSHFWISSLRDIFWWKYL